MYAPNFEGWCRDLCWSMGFDRQGGGLFSWGEVWSSLFRHQLPLGGPMHHRHSRPTRTVLYRSITAASTPL